MATYNVDVSDMTQFLLGLLNIYSPTGDTERAVAYVRRAFDALGLETVAQCQGRAHRHLARPVERAALAR